MDADDARICLTHNDFFMLNFLIDDQDDMSLIDWEYSGMPTTQAISARSRCAAS